MAPALKGPPRSHEDGGHSGQAGHENRAEGAHPIFADRLELVQVRHSIIAGGPELQERELPRDRDAAPVNGLPYMRAVRSRRCAVYRSSS